jgi:XisI protein
MGEVNEGKLASYREIIERVLEPYTAIRYANGEIENEAVFDRERDRYLIVSVGWQGVRRVQHSLIHVDIRNGKVWIQRDGTEDGIAPELEAAGIPKADIVLGFHSVEDRPLTGYAVA